MMASHYSPTMPAHHVPAAASMRMWCSMLRGMGSRSAADVLGRARTLTQDCMGPYVLHQTPILLVMFLPLGLGDPFTSPFLLFSLRPSA